MQYEIFELNFHDGILLRLHSSITGPERRFRREMRHLRDSRPPLVLASTRFSRPSWLSRQWDSHRAMWLILDAQAELAEAWLPHQRSCQEPDRFLLGNSASRCIDLLRSGRIRSPS